MLSSGISDLFEQECKYWLNEYQVSILMEYESNFNPQVSHGGIKGTTSMGIFLKNSLIEGLFLTCFGSSAHQWAVM